MEIPFLHHSPFPQILNDGDNLIYRAVGYLAEFRWNPIIYRFSWWVEEVVDPPFFPPGLVHKPQGRGIEHMGEGVGGLVDYELVVLYLLKQVLS